MRSETVVFPLYLTKQISSPASVVIVKFSSAVLLEKSLTSFSASLPEALAEPSALVA